MGPKSLLELITVWYSTGHKTTKTIVGNLVLPSLSIFAKAAQKQQKQQEESDEEGDEEQDEPSAKAAPAEVESSQLVLEVC